jgi:hypothetical protein
MTGDILPQTTGARCHLRLVPREPQARRRYETRIVVSAARLPIGRSQAFRLTESDVELLITAAMRLEAQ